MILLVLNIEINTGEERANDDFDNGYKTSSFEAIEADTNLPLNTTHKNYYNANHLPIGDTGNNNGASIKEKTMVVYGGDKTTKLILQALNNARSRWDNYADSNGPTIAMGIEQIRKGFRVAHERGVKIRYISEITKHNINYCKELDEDSRSTAYGQYQRGNGSNRNGVYCYSKFAGSQTCFPPNP